MTYQFVPYACDSTWMITSTREIDKEKVKIYPNPTNEMVHIDGINTDVEYQLYSLSSQIIKQGTTTNKAIDLENAGFFILKVKVDGKWIIKSVVKIE
ncbi:MAG TPA: T9SS type A sorting domain-containing protein [Gammaproteobacteria bacterium]|nr:T9SS type A sorting domain-containing protein [Gammaproteobacteria bacterium]